MYCSYSHILRLNSILALFFMLVACSMPVAQSRYAVIEQLQASGFIHFQTPNPLKIYVRKRLAQDEPRNSGPIRLTAYIEGDGAPWWSRKVPPANPSPTKSIAAQLAIRDHGPFVAYIGRPCQFLEDFEIDNCDVKWWTSARYSAQALNWLDNAVEYIVHDYPNVGVELIGHSGGGVMAALLAANRDDVACLITLAAPLDLDAWTRSSGFDDFKDALNPALLSAARLNLQEKHYWGRDDILVPPTSVGAYTTRVLPGDISIIDNVGHSAGWNKHWAEIKSESCLSVH